MNITNEIDINYNAPEELETDSLGYCLWNAANMLIEQYYYDLLECGVSKDIAKEILNNTLKQKLNIK